MKMNQLQKKLKSTNDIKPGNLLGKHFYCDLIDIAVEVIDERLLIFGDKYFFRESGVLVSRWDNSQSLLMDPFELEEIEHFRQALLLPDSTTNN